MSTEILKSASESSTTTMEAKENNPLVSQSLSKTPTAVASERPTAQAFALMRNTHETIRGAILDIRECINNKDMKQFVVEWRDLERMLKTHAYIEDNGMFPLLDEHFDELVKKAGLRDQHDEDEKLTAKVNKAIGIGKKKPKDKKGSIASYEKWATFMTKHMKDEEDIMMPQVPKLRKPGEPMHMCMLAHKYLVLKGIACGDWEWYVGYNLKKLEKHANGQPRARVFAHALQVSSTPGQWNNWLTIVRKSLSDELYSIIEREVGISEPGKIVVNDTKKKDTDEDTGSKSKVIQNAILKEASTSVAKKKTVLGAIENKSDMQALPANHISRKYITLI